MIVAIAWLALFLVALACELWAWQKDGVASLGRVLASLWGHRVGRVVLVALWAFVGWHLFVRSTVPPL